MKEIQLVAVVAGCVLRREGKYLLVQEKQPKAYGLWNLAAGKVDVGESIEEAAIREVYEETGFIVLLDGKINVEQSSINSPVLHAFKCKITGGELKFPAEEIMDAKWFTLDEVRQLHREGKIRVDWVIRSIEQVATSS
jgi:NADH pyrophosphatase NudC (nudix superfamily)